MLLTRWLELDGRIKRALEPNFVDLSLLEAIAEAERGVAERKECVFLISACCG